jgi:phenylalanyl-tRNA synthetase alpha subunit
MPTLNEQYNQAAEEQKNHLMQIQSAFNQHCAEITEQAKLKLSQIPESDTENRQIIIEEQKQKLAETLLQLKKEINLSGNKTRKQLEQIHAQRELQKLQDLEQAISKI